MCVGLIIGCVWGVGGIIKMQILQRCDGMIPYADDTLSCEHPQSVHPEDGLDQRHRKRLKTLQ